MATDRPTSVNLTAAGLTMPDFFAAIFAYFSATSVLWTALNSEVITGPGPAGSYSFTLRSVGAFDVELNWRNQGTQAAPLAQARIGVNPDGSVDPITDSISPWLSAANFSGVDGGAQLDFNEVAAPSNTEFTVHEWADAVAVVFKDAGRTAWPQGVHVGRIVERAYAGDANGPDILIDGTAVTTTLPSFSNSSGASVDDYWINATGKNDRKRMRLGAGQGVGTTQQSAWINQVAAGTAVTLTTLDSTVGAPSPQVRPGPIPIAVFNRQAIGFSKYLRVVPPSLPYTLFQVAGLETYMTLGHTAASNNAGIIVADNFNPRP